MSWQYPIRVIALVLVMITFESDVIAFVNNPKIITRDGNLIFESGLNRNISIRLGGTSRLIINDEIDLLKLLNDFKMRRGNYSSSGGGQWTEDDEEKYQILVNDVKALRTGIYGSSGITKRIRLLQNRTRTNNQLLRSYQTRLRNAENRIKEISDKLNLDNCASNPCDHGGTCLNTFNGYYCKCRDSFEGTNCEKDVNECVLFAGTDKGCQNGGQCVNQFGGFNCLCAPGWVGIHCSERKGDCMKSSNWERCGHGVCVNSNDDFGYKCICDLGWKTNGLTPTCMTDVNECTESHPPCTTRCINLPGSFMCEPCGPGLTGIGINCRDINECETNNGGCSLRPFVNCINSYGSYHCDSCPLGWVGDGRTCTLADSNSNSVIGTCANSNICHPSATCSEISNTVVCVCPKGMVGSGIGLNGCVVGTATNCESNPCPNGGTCIDSGSTYTCICPPGYLLPNCTPISNPCVPNPCRNNGVCRRTGPTDFECKCPPGHIGRYCDDRFNSCGGVLAGTMGILKYPEHSPYEHSSCSWIIRTNVTQVLNVTFTAFDVEDSTECRFDFLQINDGPNAASQVIGRFCGPRKPRGGTIISTTNQLFLWFKSDNTTSKAGFELSWNSISPQCGGFIEIESHATIASPGAPSAYPKNRDCRWQLKAANNKRIKLTFFNMQIETHDSCNFDYVEITDSSSNELIEKFCTSTHPSPLLLPTNEATIHFHSDGVGSDTGFQIYFSLEERVPGCGGTFTAKEGIIRSPSFIGDYISCEYDIKMSQSESVRITFDKFEMDYEDCIEIYDINPVTQMRLLQSKYCGGLAVYPTPFYSLYNAVRIIFYSKGGSFELSYKADCSFTYDSPSGQLQSPSYPIINTVEQMYQCTYKILAEPGFAVVLNFDDVDLRDKESEDDDCVYTNLRIRDQDESDTQGPFCNKKPSPLVITSKTNLLILYFTAGPTSIGRGFRASYTTVRADDAYCGGFYIESGQTIKLPTGPDGVYKDNMECYWIIIAPSHQGIQLTWKSFNLENTSDCVYDYLEIYDTVPNTTDSKPLGRFCNSRPPPTLLSQTSVMTLKFVSDVSDAGDGFEVTYNFVELDAMCGGDIFSSNGRIYSPGWPRNYTNGMDCTWTITTPPGTQMELSIDIFELEDSDKCSGDWLEIRNGGSMNSTLIGYFCGATILKRIPSFTNQMRLHLHTDSFKSARGFQIRWYIYASGCGGILQSELGVITSPFYPNNYPHDTFCEWTVIVNSGSKIYFTIEDLSMETLMNCNYDSLQIFDGRTNSDNSLGRFCSLEYDEPKKIETTSNEALVQFRTDSSSSERGFLLSYYASCRRDIHDVHGVIMSPNYNNSYYRNDVNCSWNIIAPKGNRIEMEFSYFDVLDPENGYVNVTDKAINGSVTHIVRRIGNYKSTGNMMTVTQVSALVSFRLEYTITGCISVLTRDNGEFTSPNYSKMYPNDIECLWTIKTSLGEGIELTIEDLDIEESVNCTNDALIISNHLYSDNPKEYHCGHQAHALIINSAVHILYVRFKSNNQVNGKGFKASYKIIKKPKCGGVLQAKNGIITSPNYPLNYPPNANCEWIIRVEPYHTISITVEELDLEDSFNCTYDYVELFDYIGGANEENKIFSKCGTLVSEDQIKWKTKTDTALIRFTTDDSQETKGFKFSFEQNCGSNIVVEDLDYSYINLNTMGQPDRTCEWQLKAADPTKHIMFTTTHVILSPLLAMTYKTEGDCMEAGVKIYDGIGVNMPVRSQFCKQHPPAIISHGHAITIQVPMKVISEFEGYYQIFDGLCGGYFHTITGRFATPYYPASYPVNMDCIWNLVASEGNSLVLTIESMDLEDSDSCNHDYLEVRDNHDRGKLHGIFCGSEVPPSIRSSSTMLWVKFSSDLDNVGEGFMATYNYAFHNEINGSEGTIESPNYPTVFQSVEAYTWRITVDKEYVVMVSMEHVRDIDIPYIKFYDGYTDIGPEISYINTHTIRSNTHVLFLRSTRGPFRFVWNRLSKEAVRSNETASQMSTKCGHNMVTVASTISFNSPGYPNGYDANLKCDWTFVPANPSTHAVLQFQKIDLEEFGQCQADYVRISSGNDLQKWRELDKLCKKPNNTFNQYHGAPYLRLEFITDAGVNKTGFSSTVKTTCGSILTDRQGYVNITSLAKDGNFFNMDCVWKIRVRKGRRVRITFEESYIRSPNSTNNCRNYFITRNGNADDSPFLGKGKYCDNYITDVLETTSNRAYVKFSRLGFPKFRAAFRYEEINHDCSSDILLSDETESQRSMTISSPNYPNIPNPHLECIWRVTAPVHHIITIDFIGTFDLANSLDSFDKTIDCNLEYVQLNEGTTKLMPLLGRFCGKSKPNTIYTKGNHLLISYFTDVAEPHIGFQANVSIGRCGGSYYGDSATIVSPDNLVLHGQEIESYQCVYTIEVAQGSTINLTLTEMNFDLSYNCSEVTHLDVQEIDNFEGEENVTDTLQVCNGKDRYYIVETNKVIIRYNIRRNDKRSFKIIYSAIGDRCGQTIESFNGILQTPGYPNGVTKPTHCSWHLIVPKGQRIKIIFLDFDTGVNSGSLHPFAGRLTFANDFKMFSIITRVSENPPDAVYSTDNTMDIDAFMLPFNKHRGFKLRFSAVDSTVCRANIDLENGGVINFRSINDTSLYCRYDLKMRNNETLVFHIDRYSANQTYMSWSLCVVTSPIKFMLNQEALLPRLLCGESKDRYPAVRLPFPVQLTLNANRRNHMRELDLSYKVYKCGGIVPLFSYSNLTINAPTAEVGYTNELECAWAVWPNNLWDVNNMENLDEWIADAQIEISLETNFIGNCEDHYLLLYNGPNQNAPHLGRYCNQATADNLVVERGFFLEYYTKNYDTKSTFNVTVKLGSGCGGVLHYPYRDIIFSEQYKDNTECIWEVETEPGFHLGLSFTDRFFIESSRDCSKDYLLVEELNTTDDWIQLAKLCGRDPPAAINTTSTRMRLTFRSDGDTVGDGFTTHIERNCGGVLYATNTLQEVFSPGYPEKYQNLLYCNYTILPTHEDDAGVLIRFKVFEVEEAPSTKCMFDNVTIKTQDHSERKETILCGKRKFKVFRAKDRIEVIFRTDQSFTSKGFLFEYTNRLCGGLITNTSLVESPKQQDNGYYLANSNCYWNLTAPEGYKIQIKFEELDFESNMHCLYDGLEIYKGLVRADDQRLYKFCGNMTGQVPILTIPSNKGLIYTFSDHRDESKGFRALVTFMPDCDRRIFLDSNNSTYDFNTYASGYSNNLDCRYNFNAIPGQQFQIEFTSFHLEESRDCMNDFLEIRDGGGPFAEEIGKFCGHIMPSRLLTSRNSLFIRFVSDDEGTSSGFVARITSKPLICGQHRLQINDKEKIVVKSPEGDNGNYRNDVNCFWRISASKMIHIHFDKMDIESPNDTTKCGGDYLKIYNSEDEELVEKGFSKKVIFNGQLTKKDYSSFATEHIYCGNKIPADYYSRDNNIFIKFKSDESGSKSGFSLTAMAVEGCFRNYTGTQGRILLKDTADHCDIYINSPQNYTLNLYYALVLFAEYDCSVEYIEVFDVRTNTSLQKICSNTDPSKSLFTNTNALRMRIKMNGFYTQYDLTYVASSNGIGCGGELYNTGGIITSPFYPNTEMRNNYDCRWNIRVPGNVHVLLNFKIFDMGAKSTCHSDYLQIIEHNDDGTESVVRQFCGEDKPTAYKSPNSYVTIRYHKTVNFDGTGWVISFNGVHANYEPPRSPGEFITSWDQYNN